MQTEKLSSLRKELLTRPTSELVHICLALAKLKSDNKEMLAYLLYDQDNPLGYAESLKVEIDQLMQHSSHHPYSGIKSMRKALQLITKYSRFTKSKQGEIELLLHFLKWYFQTVSPETRFAPLLTIAFRTLRKVYGLISRLHEDLQYDYGVEYNALLYKAQEEFLHWDHYRFPLQQYAQ